MILDSRRSFDPGRGSMLAILLTVLFTYIAAVIVPGPSLGFWPWTALIALGGVHLSLYVFTSAINERLNRTLLIVGYFLAQLIVCGCIQFIGHGHFWLLLLPLTSMASFLFARKAMAIFLLCILGLFLFPLRLGNFSNYLQETVIFVSALVFVLVFTEVAIHERQARAEKETLAIELERANRLLMDHAAQAEELTRTRERNRLAREIHDSLGHSLTVVNVQLEVAKALADHQGWKDSASEVYSALEKAQLLTRDGLADVRRSVAALRAEPLAEKPLPESISGLFTASEANGLMTAFHCQGAERTLPPAVAWTLYRTAQEALTNVRKHARASQVEALLTYNVSSVQLEIRDNGIGFSGDGSGDGKFGLLGLRERADLLHGRFSVVSSPQTGTTVTMELPLA